jgi:hypothetical protein
MCDKFSVLCNLAELNEREERRMSEDKTCWSCGHYLIGGGCWKDGDPGEDGWRNAGPDDSCEGWVEETTPGTINGAMYEMMKFKEEAE